MTLDLVVARVAEALGRGHSLFAAAPLDAGAGLAGSSQTLSTLSNRIAASPASLGSQGQFANAYGDVAQQVSARLSGTAGMDAKLSGLVSDAANADAAGRNQSGQVVNAAASDTARTAPFTNTPAGDRALLMALRDRVNEQRQVIGAYKARDAKLAAMVRQLGYQQRAAGRGGGGFPAAMSGLGGMRPPTSGGGGSGLGGFSLPNFAGLAKTSPGAHNSGAASPLDGRLVADPHSGLGGTAAEAALGKRGTAYVWGAKGPRNFDCSGLTQWAWKQVGVQLGPDTYSQMKQGVQVPPGQVRAGDLIFPNYSRDGRGFGHVMLAISPTQVVHAPQTGDVVKVSPMPSGFMARRPQ
ncbi:NlpC/P60 family protein [Mycolicibacterium peregrinum]|uniref:NlpC/P60 family protein n=2 Tax=Mycobacteriaceae TaxID=1762 RepID=UPI003AAC0BE7